MTSDGEEEGREEEEEVVADVAPVGGGGLPPHHHSGGGQPPPGVLLDDLGDLTRLHAARADAHPLNTPVSERTHRDQVRQPPALRVLVRVADGTSDGGTFPAHIATLSHDHSSEAGSSQERPLLIARSGPTRQTGGDRVTGW